MYLCKKCGNKRCFIEQNHVKTELTLDEDTGRETGHFDTFISCSDVSCGICHASSEDGDILSRETGEKIIVSV